MRFDSAYADRLMAVILLCLGASMTWGGFVMDRLEIRQIHPASIPGLVPMILGVALMICAVLLALGADGVNRAAGVAPGSWRNFSFTAIWSCFFALILVGRLPFALAVAIYVIGFVGWFVLPSQGPGPARIRRLLFVLAFGAITATAIATLFRYGFLVRLP